MQATTTQPTDFATQHEARELISELQALRDEMEQMVAQHFPLLDRLSPETRESGENLVRYVTARQHDLRPIQRRLHHLGISSLGRMEPYVDASLESVIRVLRLVAGEANFEASEHLGPKFQHGRARLVRQARGLFGPLPEPRQVSVMVTMPSDATEHPELIRNLLAAGMNIMRINCAKDSPVQWQQMIGHLRAAEVQLGQSCKVFMDLAGPNPRTGPLAIRKKRKSGPRREVTYRLRPGDQLVITSDDILGRDAIRDSDGHVVEPATIGCTLAEMLEYVRVGQRILYDDGGLEAVVQACNEQEVTVEVIRARKGAVKIRSGKSLNFPDTHAPLSSLTDKDLVDLEFIAHHADAVGFSFVRTAEDVRQLLKQFERLGADDLGVVLKIETQDAFRNLPMLLLTAMQRPRVGVMVARGDMGAEFGFGRMGEVQEEILWLCEAAHVPVIWATEVLDSLAKNGVPTRGDVTDAAMASRAECVMLNKGKYIVDAVEFLVDILGRMNEHQRKKYPRLRKLHVCCAEEGTDVLAEF